MGKLMRALGLMSGTSLDGIDVAMVTTDGETAIERGPAMTFPYNADMRALLRSALNDATAIRHRDDRPGCLTEAENSLTVAHAQAVEGFLAQRGLERGGIDVIGFHGQTVLHRPVGAALGGAHDTPTSPVKRQGVEVGGLTVQIGRGDQLADLTGCAVVSDMRANDVARGGQGAPLVPIYHHALVSRLGPRPIAIVNIGGVANVTLVEESLADIRAFDTGPGNALIDDLILGITGEPYDAEGALAAVGRVDEERVTGFLRHPFFAQVPPKSLDRQTFQSADVRDLPLADAVATLTAFTARAIAGARAHTRREPQLWIVCGGGRKNKTLMRMLAERVENAVVPAETVGLDGDSLEAEAWGYLAVRALHGLPLTFPGTTGVPSATCGGIVSRPRPI